jgi:hypothetical protein
MFINNHFDKIVLSLGLENYRTNISWTTRYVTPLTTLDRHLLSKTTCVL